MHLQYLNWTQNMIEESKDAKNEEVPNFFLEDDEKKDFLKAEA